MKYSIAFLIVSYILVSKIQSDFNIVRIKDQVLFSYKSGCLEAAELPIAECEMRAEEFYKETYEYN